MNIWQVAMECSGISEAGGVKDVVYSLSKGLASLRNSVTLFLPAFGCTSFDRITSHVYNVASAEIDLRYQTEHVEYSTGKLKDTSVSVVFIHHPSFANKRSVYVYTEEDQAENPAHVKGTGHEDSLFLDALFSKAVAHYLSLIPDSEQPNVIHCHDAPCAVLPCYAERVLGKQFFKTRCIVTVHNAGPAYHHNFENIDQAHYYTGLDYNFLGECTNYGRVEPFLLGAKKATLTTVSEYYAAELTDYANNQMTDGLSAALIQNGITVTGITNGIDFEVYNPCATEKSLLPYKMPSGKRFFSAKEQNRSFFMKLCKKEYALDNFSKQYIKSLEKFGHLLPASEGTYTAKTQTLFVYHGRIVWQKGISVLLDSLERLFAEFPNCMLCVCGQGDSEFEMRIQQATSRFDGRMVFFKGYNNFMARLCVAAADFSFMPSLFEPCGLEDFISQIYGTLPIAHATGGLNKIIDGKNGFLYKESNSDSFISAVRTAVEVSLQEGAMRQMSEFARKYVRTECSWNSVIKNKYVKLFKNRPFTT